MEFNIQTRNTRTHANKHACMHTSISKTRRLCEIHKLMWHTFVFIHAHFNIKPMLHQTCRLENG